MSEDLQRRGIVDGVMRFWRQRHRDEDAVNIVNRSLIVLVS